MPSPLFLHTKERAIYAALQTHFPAVAWKCQQKIDGGCSNRRPDFFADFGAFVLIIEIAWGKQISASVSPEEELRMNQISMDIGTRPMFVLRFNPHEYVNAQGDTVPSCFSFHRHTGVTRVVHGAWQHRLNTLCNKVDSCMRLSEWPYHDRLMVEECLFYDC